MIERATSSATVAWRIVLGLGILSGMLLGSRYGLAWLPTVIEQMPRFGLWAPLAFVGFYGVATVTLLPCFVLTLASGALFGLPQGVLYAFTGAVLGATGSFLIARHALRAAIARRVTVDPRFEAIDRAVAARGRWIVFLIRSSPVFPFVYVNYALGLTQVRLADYVLASVGMLPTVVMYVYYGTVVGEIALSSREGLGTALANRPGYYALLALGLAATIAVAVVVARIATRALAEADTAP